MADRKNETDSGPESLSSLSSLNIDTTGGTVTKKEKQKVDILLKPVGDAPVISKKKWSVESDKPISYVSNFLKKVLKLEAQERVILYVNQTFAPSPDQTLGNLVECYGTTTGLVLHYCKNPAWG